MGLRLQRLHAYAAWMCKHTASACNMHMVCQHLMGLRHITAIAMLQKTSLTSTWGGGRCDNVPSVHEQGVPPNH